MHENVAPGTHVQRDVKARVFWRRVVAPPGSAAPLPRLGSHPQLLPLIRQQLVESAIRMRADPIQHDPQAYLRDVLDRISTHQAKRIAELLLDQWQELRQASGASVEDVIRHQRRSRMIVSDSGSPLIAIDSSSGSLKFASVSGNWRINPMASRSWSKSALVSGLRFDLADWARFAF
jgi:hypothetical protein